MNNLKNKKLKINYKKILAYLWLFIGYFIIYFFFALSQIMFNKSNDDSIYINFGEIMTPTFFAFSFYLIINHLLLKNLIRGKILFLTEMLVFLSIVSVFILHWAVKFING